MVYRSSATIKNVPVGLQVLLGSLGELLLGCLVLGIS